MQITLTVKDRSSLQVVRNLIADKDNAFSMENGCWDKYTQYPEDSHRGSCGTPACIAGWARHLSYFTYRRLMDMDVGAKGLLFRPFLVVNGEAKCYMNTPQWFTRARTVAMLDKLISTGEFDWFALEAK